MHFNKKITAVACLLAAVGFMSMAGLDPDHDHKAKNLKVLPKDIPHHQLHEIMDEWSHSLGVKCNFCHAAGADNKMDFASDAKPEKDMARDMFKMMAKINKTYFKGHKDTSGMVVGDMKCVTCHRGDPHPDDVKVGGMDDDHGHHDDHMGPPPGGMPPMGTPPPGQ